MEYVKDAVTGGLIDPGTYDFSMSGDIGVLYRDMGWTFRGYPYGLANDYRAASRYLEVKFTAGYVLPKDATEDEPSDLPADIISIVWGIAEQEYSILVNGSPGAFCLLYLRCVLDLRQGAQGVVDGNPQPLHEVVSHETERPRDP